MKKLFTMTLTLSILGALAVPTLAQDKNLVPSADEAKTQEVRINGVRLDEADLRRIEQKYHFRIPTGDYWYDKVSGAWGRQGGPTIGFTVAGVKIGGPLRADASNGHTGVFVNGRQLHTQDVIGLQQLGIPVRRGRWWVLANGDFGSEGNPFPLGNLVRMARRSQRGSAYSRRTAGGYIGSDGDTFYFFDPQSGSSVMGH